MEGTIADLQEIIVRRKNRTILGPLSLTIKKGEFWGIIGPNGAGKSTLLKLLTGKKHLHGEHVSLMGQTITHGFLGKHSSTAHLKHIGILHQHHDFLPDIPFTVEDIVLFGRLMYSGPGRPYRTSDKKALEYALDCMGITALRYRLYRELSGGEQRKVHLARLVAQEPELLLLDEPTAGLDIDWKERLTGLVGDLYHDLGKTVVMVTHEIDRLPSCCNRVLLLKHGISLATGAPDEVFTGDMLSQLYGCDIEVAVRNGRYHAFSLGLAENI